MTTEELIALQGRITPGPWCLSPDEEGLPAQCVSSRGWDIATAWGGYNAGKHDATLIAMAPDLLAEVIRLRAFLDDLATAKVETIPRRRRDPQDDEPDMMDADMFYAWQEDARALLAGKAGA